MQDKVLTSCSWVHHSQFKVHTLGSGTWSILFLAIMWLYSLYHTQQQQQHKLCARQAAAACATAVCATHSYLPDTYLSVPTHSCSSNVPIKQAYLKLVNLSNKLLAECVKTMMASYTYSYISLSTANTPPTHTYVSVQCEQWLGWHSFDIICRCLVISKGSTNTPNCLSNLSIVQRTSVFTK